MKLSDDFNIWWNMPKYSEVEILAREFSDVEIVQRNASNQDWPGPEKDVQYWVELENGYAVGVITPRKKPATCPFYKMHEYHESNN